MNALEKARRRAMVDAADALDRQTIEILKKSLLSRYDHSMIKSQDNKEDKLMRILIGFKDGSRAEEVVEEINMRMLTKSLNEKDFILVNNTIVTCSEVRIIKVIKEDKQS